MSKTETIEILIKGHKEFQGVLETLGREWEAKKLIGEWTARDTMAHIAAWNKEYILEIDRMLADKPLWPAHYGGSSQEDEFNAKAVAERKNWPGEKIKAEWEDSFAALVGRMQAMTDADWEHVCPGQTWRDGTLATMRSIFSYEENGTSHEGVHARNLLIHIN
jgi:hypothetical protein